MNDLTAFGDAARKTASAPRSAWFGGVSLLCLMASSLLAQDSIPAVGIPTPGRPGRSARFHPQPPLGTTSLFGAAVTYSTGGLYPVSMAVADLNGDGVPDLVVTNSAYTSPSGTVGVLLGKGDGTFKTAVTYKSGGFNPTSVVAVDVNKDGKVDLLVSNQCLNSACQNGGGANAAGVLSVLLGNGDGTFKAAVTYNSGGYFAANLAVADVNRDGFPDVLVTNQCATTTRCPMLGGTNGNVAVLAGKGDGTFKTAVTYDSGGTNTTALVIGDVDGDGNPDLIVSNFCGSDGSCLTGTVGVLLGDGDGTFDPVTTYSSGAYGAGGIAATDVSGNGKLDLLVSSYLGSVGVLLGNGDGTFQAAISYGSGGYAAGSVALADVNGDNKLDLVVSNQCTSTSSCSNGAVGVLLGNGDGTFQAATGYGSGGYLALSAAVADVNQDGKLDLLVTNQCVSSTSCKNGTVGVLLNSNIAVASTTTLSSALNPSTYGQAVTLTATVVPSTGSGTPTGTVTFLNGTASLGTSTLSKGVASLTVSSLTTGTDSIVASYAGDPNFLPSTSTALSQTVNQATSTATLVSSLNPSLVNQSVTLTATVSGQYGGTATGTITFKQGGTTFGTVTLVNGQASITKTETSAGTFSINASYSADTNFKSSTSTNLLQVANKASTTTKLTSSPNPSNFGLSVTFTATVASSGPSTPTGSVQILDGTTTLGTPNLNNGVATFAKTTLSVGTHSLTAVYNGDAASLTSTSSVVSQVVSQAITTTTMTSSLNPSKQGQAVTFTATVTAPNENPTGTVTFTAGSSVLGTVTLSGNKASLTNSSLATGSTVITATYNGGTDFTVSSVSLTQVVNP